MSEPNEAIASLFNYLATIEFHLKAAAEAMEQLKKDLEK